MTPGNSSLSLTGASNAEISWIRSFYGTAIIGRKPDFAEGWNKRATLYYSIGEYQKSLRDCDEVIKRNPLHFGALAGYGLIYVQLDQPDRALEYFKRALKINPNMQGVANNIELLEKQGRTKRGNFI